MKKILTMMMMASATLLASASMTRPDDIFIDFAKTDFSEWTQYSSGQTPVAGYQPYFAEGNAYFSMPWSGGVAAMSCSQFTDGGESDEWLITPEFEVTGDNMVLYYTVITMDNSINNKYKILVSETGESREDFKTLVNNVVKGNSSEGFATRCQALKDYAGKKIRLALVNSGNKTGLLGFANVGVGAYYVNVAHADTYDYMIITDPTSPISMDVSLSTPVNTNGFTAVLETGDFKSEYVSTKLINITSISQVSFAFPDGFDFDGESPYSITITPNYENAPATVISGTIIVANPYYPKVVLIEEMTSTKCTFCPRGTAFIEYYKDKYDGKGGKGRVIASVIHNYMGGIDPMTISGNPYRDDMEDFIEVISPSMAGLLPSAVYNRSGVSDPSGMPIDQIMAQKGVALAKISRIDYDGTAKGKVTVNFTTEISYSSMDAGLNYSAVVIENGVYGAGVNWSQSNAFSGAAPETIVSMYGEDLLKYFTPFITAPSLITDIVYNDVARGCFPSFSGNILEGEFEAYQPREFSLEFNMPSNVSDPKNTEIILLVTSRSSGEVMSADIVGASDYNKDLEDEASVESITSSLEGLSVSRDNGGFRVVSPCEGELVIYSIEGKAYGIYPLKEGENMIPCEGRSMMLLNARLPEGVKTFKIMPVK